MIDIKNELDEFLRELDRMGRSVLDVIEIEYMKKDFLATVEEYLIEQFADSEISEDIRDESYHNGYEDGYTYGYEAGYSEGHDQGQTDARAEQEAQAELNVPVKNET